MASKVAWMARTTTTVVGLAIMLALVFGVGSMAFAANGGNFVLGVLTNTATAVTKLTGNVAGKPALQVVNPNTGAGSHALQLITASGKPPIVVNATAGKAVNLNADKLDGKDFSAFGAEQLFNSFGPLPKESTFTSKGGTLILSLFGSGFRGTGTSQKEGLIGMSVSVDGVFRGLVDVYTNERNSHKAFVPATLVVRNLPAGQHTIRLEEGYNNTTCNTANETQRTYCTDTDSNDIFQVTVVEIPD